MPTIAQASGAGRVDDLQTSQESVYGPATPPVRTDSREEAAQLIAKIQAIPDSKERAKASKAAGAEKLYGIIPDDLRKRYGIENISTHKSGGILGTIGRAVTSVPGAKTALSVLSRPSQAVQQFVQTGLNPNENNLGSYFKDLVVKPGEALTGAFQPGAAREGESANLAKIVHRDRNYVSHGKGDAALNFLGDVALDPTTYLTGGVSAAGKSGLGALAREGVDQGLLKAITEKGLNQALADAGGTLTKDALEETLRKAAAKGGSKNVDRLVAKQMKGIEDTAQGGARLAGQTIPGTTNLLHGNQLFGEATKLADRFSGEGAISAAAKSAAEAGHDVRGNLADIFSTRAGVRRDLGKTAAADLGAIQHGSRSLTERLATGFDQEVSGGLHDISPEEIANFDKMTPEHVAVIDSVVEKAKRINDQFGGLVDADKILAHPDYASNPALGAHRLAQEVSRKAGIARLTDELPEAGLGKTVDQVLGDSPANKLASETKTLEPAGHFSEAQPNTVQPDLLTGQVPDVPEAARIAQATEVARKQGLVPLTASNGKTVFVHPTISEEIGKFSTRITSDQGVQVMRDAYKTLLRKWKTAATVLPISPAFFTRNGQGNVILMAGKGFTTPKNFGPAWDMIHAINTGATAELPEELQKTVALLHSHNVLDAGQVGRELGAEGENVERLLTKGAKTGKGSRLGKAYTGLTEKGTHLNKTIEDTSRAAMFMDGLDKGLTPAEAAARTEDALFNYADITKGEEMVKQAVPFYTFMRKNLQHQSELLTTAPGKITGQVHAMDALDTAFGNKNGELPSWAVMAGYLPFGGTLVRADTPLLSAADSVAPLSELANVLPGGAPVDYGTLVGQGVLGPMGGPLPGLLKAGVEAKTGTSLFSGGPVHKGIIDNPLVGNLVPSGGRLTGTVQNVEAAAHGDLRGLLPLVGLSGKSIADMEPGVLTGRVIDAQNATQDSPLPRLDALRNAGLVPPKAPVEQDYTGMTAQDERRARTQFRRDTQEYVRELRRYERTKGHPSRQQKALLAGLQAGPPTE